MGDVKFGDFPSYTNEANFVYDLLNLGIEAQRDLFGRSVSIDQSSYAEYRERIDALLAMAGGRIID